MKDKFWFFGSFQYQKDADSQPGTDPAFPARSSAKRYFWKVNYQLNQENRFQVQTHDDFYRIPGRATANTAPSTLGVENGHNPSPGVLWTSVINSTTVVEARYSGFYGVDHGDPLNGGPRVARRFNDLDTGQITGGIYSWYDGKSAKTAFSGKVTKYADKFMGGQPRLQARRAVQQRPRRIHLRPERLHLHLRRHPGVWLHAVAVHPGRPAEGRSASLPTTRISSDAPRSIWASATTTARPTSPRRISSTPAATRPGRSRRAVDDVFRLARRLAAARRQLQGERERLDAAQGALRPLLPWHRHRRVRQHHAVDHAEICVLGTLQRQPASRWTRNWSPTTPDCRSIPNLKNPYTDQFIAGLRAAGRAKPRVRGELRLQTQRAANGVPRHRRHVSAGARSPLRPAPTCRRCTS